MLNRKNTITGRTLKRQKDFKEQLSLLLLLLPGVILLFMFNYVPMGGAVIAFKDFNPNLGIFDSPWCGFKNFEFFFTSQDALRLTRNTVLYALWFRVIGMVAAIALALALYEVTSRKALKTYQTIMILPHFLSWVLVGYITYSLLNPVSGLLNSLLQFFGAEPIAWYSEPKYWPAILTVTQIWKFVGMDSIIYYAALMGIDASLFEAARVDGANKWQEIIKIKLPQLAPTISILLILGLSSIFRGDFGLFYQIPRDVGVLYPVTDIVDTYLYRGLQQGNMGITSAVGLFQSVVGFIMVLITNAVVRKIDAENSIF